LHFGQGKPQGLETLDEFETAEVGIRVNSPPTLNAFDGIKEADLFIISDGSGG